MTTFGVMTVAAQMMGTGIPLTPPIPPVTLAALYGAGVTDVGVVCLTAVALLLAVAHIVRPPRVRRTEQRRYRMAA